jgi:hypothetical protein
MAGVALAQNPPNAIGIWNSNGIPPGTLIAGAFNGPDGTTGNKAWKVLSSEVTNYFRNIGSGSARTIDFRGLDFYMAVPQASTGSPSEVPAIDLVDGIQPGNAPFFGHFIPNPTPTVFASFPSALWGANPIGAAVFFHYVTVTPTAVPSGAAAGSALCAVFKDYFKTGTNANQKTWLLMSFIESLGPSTSNDASGFTTAAGANFVFGGNFEYAVSFLFDQSMIAPIKNARLASGTDTMPGGGAYPAIFAPVICDDGKGALRPLPGDSLSWMGNSNTASPPNVNAPWLVPFTYWSGDAGGPPGPPFTPDPTPEDWVDDNGVVQNMYIHTMSEQKYVDDLADLFSQAHIGAALNPINSTRGLYLGTDMSPPLAGGFLNISAVLDGIAMADISTPLFGGPELLRYDSVLNPGGFIGINLDNLGTKTAEVKNPLAPATGWTVINSLGGQLVGYVDIPLAAVLTGTSYSINCWVLDEAAPFGFGPFKVNDLTNIIRVQF